MEETVSEDVIRVANERPVARRAQSPLRGGPWLSALLILAALALAWEAAKIVFGVSDQKLPHLWAIAGVFFDRPQGGEGPLRAVLMFQNAATTLGEAIMGFVLGGILGCLLATIFAASRLLERSLLPYVVGSQT